MNGDSEPHSPSLLAEFNAPELLNLLADGAYITDRNRQIVFWNQAAERITGWRAQEVLGRACKDSILMHVDKDGHQLCGFEHCPLHRSMVTGQSSSEPLLVFANHHSGSRIPVEVMVSPIRDHCGNVVGGIEVFRDLTDAVRDQLRAKEIQQMAVACELPGDARIAFETSYEPRDIVGGDFYRIEQIHPDEYAVLVADAKGHGVAAALYTLLLRSLWEDHRADLRVPGEFMRLLNSRLHSLAHGVEYFGTAVLALYNAQTGVVRVVRAGHPKPLLLRVDGSAASFGKENPALGMFPETAYLESADCLRPGDALLLYTDGATELFDADEQELGTDGLLRLLRQLPRRDRHAGVSLTELEKQLLLYTNQIHFPDDLTMVEICRPA